MGWQAPAIEQLAPVALLVIVTFLSYPSQWLFANIEPAPLVFREGLRFNVFLIALYVAYFRVLFSDPGQIPRDWYTRAVKGKVDLPSALEQPNDDQQTGHAQVRWCRRCDTHKPPRAHHCKTCGRSAGAVH